MHVFIYVLKNLLFYVYILYSSSLINIIFMESRRRRRIDEASGGARPRQLVPHQRWRPRPLREVVPPALVQPAQPRPSSWTPRSRRQEAE